MKKMPIGKVSVVREKLVACMRCGICDKLMREATTISECMHHFCRKCIYKKINVDEVENCPVCDVHIGADPLEKLRPDHNLRELRAKIFGFKKSEAQLTNVESESLSESHAKGKKRSLSSLGGNVLKQKSDPVLMGRRMRQLARKSRYLQLTSHLEKSNGKYNNLNDHGQNSSSSEDRNNSPVENSDDQWPLVKKITDRAERNLRPPHNSDDIWNPLNCLVEAANKNKPVETEIPDDVQMRKRRMKDYTFKTNNDKSLQFTNPKKSRKNFPKKMPEIPICVIPSPHFPEDFSSKEGRSDPIWFRLVASENQCTQMPLPQIPKSYLRINLERNWSGEMSIDKEQDAKLDCEVYIFSNDAFISLEQMDGSMAISHVRGYIMHKLDILNEDEIEISCMGQPLIPLMPLTDVVNTWLQTTGTPTKFTITVNSSAKDFIMVLTYARKAPTLLPPPPPTSSLSFLHL